MKQSLILRPLQKDVLDKLVDKNRVNIFAGMGSGKTTITLFDLLRKQIINGDVFPVIVFAPLYVANGVWSSEIDRFEEFKNIRYSIITGVKRNREIALNKDADIYITNYENAHWLVNELKGTLDKFNTVVCDESTKIKNHRRRSYKTQQGYVVEERYNGSGTKQGNAVVLLAQYVKYWYNLSGTPTPKGLVDLWGQQFPIDKGQALGSNYTTFTRLWCEPINPLQPNWGCSVPQMFQQKLLDAIKDNTVTVYAEDYYNLDKPIISTIKVSLSETLKKQYNKLKEGVLAELISMDYALDLMSAGTITMKLRQFCSGKILNPETEQWDSIHTLKIDALKDYCEEHSDENILIAYHFRYEATEIQKALGEQAVILTHKNSSEVIDKWNKGEIKYLLIHPQSAGHGLNLQHGGRRMLFYTLDYNLETHEQAIARIGVVRQFQSGYKRAVFIDYLVVTDSVDEKVATALQNKRDVAKSVKDYLMEAK